MLRTCSGKVRLLFDNENGEKKKKEKRGAKGHAENMLCERQVRLLGLVKTCDRSIDR